MSQLLYEVMCALRDQQSGIRPHRRVRVDAHATAVARASRVERIRRQRALKRAADGVADGWADEIEDEVSALRSAAPLGALAAAVRDRDARRAERAAVPKPVLERSAPATLGKGVAVGRRTTQAELTGSAAKGAAELGRRPEAGQRAAAWAKTRSASLVREVTDETRAAVRGAVERAVAAGTHPTAAARDVRQIVGLHSRQAAAVSRYRVGLAASGLKPSMVEQRSARYAEQLLRQRAETIARTECFAALNRGRADLWEELVREGVVERGRMVRTWMSARDERTEDVCLALDGQQVGLEEPFSSIEGDIFEPPVHPRCRCTLLIEEVSR